MASLTQNILRVFRTIDATDHRQRRLWNLAQGVVTNLGSRVLGLAIAFFSVPLTIGYLGREQYGAWLSIVSLTAWMSLTDLGLGNGLTNAVTTAVGQDRPDLVRMHLSNGVIIMSATAGVIALGVALAWPYVDWADILGVHTPEARAEVAPAVAVVLAALILNMPLSLADKVYRAYQQGRISNYWGMAGNVLSFACLVAVTRTQGGLVWLAMALSGTPLGVSAASNIHAFAKHRPEVRPHWRHADLPEMLALGKAGGGFFLSQLTGLITYQTDNLVIDQFLGASHVPEYSVTYSLFNYTTLPLSVAFSHMWVAYTEAIARGDMAWVRRAYNLHLWGGFGLVILATAVLVLIAQPFIGWWAGASVVPAMPLVWAMAVWSLVNGSTNPIWCLLAASSHLRLQAVFSVMSSTVNVVLSIILVQKLGVVGVIVSTDIAYCVCLCVPVYVIASRLLSTLERRHAQTHQLRPL